MNNFMTLFGYELKKIFKRKIALTALLVIFAMTAAVDIAEYTAVKRTPECNDAVLVGRRLDDELFDEMRGGIVPTVLTDSLGNEEIEK